MIEVYLKQPQPSTILVICYKYKTLDKRKKFAKELAKKEFIFESKKNYTIIKSLIGLRTT